MWYSCNPIPSETLEAFEKRFDFTINPPLRDFLLTHNAGKSRLCELPTEVRNRRIASLLDFSDVASTYNINTKMRRMLGDKYIIIGMDRNENYLAVRRNYRQQEFVIWNHASGKIEECLVAIPVILMYWQKEEEKA